VSKIQPEDFVVISTNQSSPWVRDTEYKIPAGLPACPEAGCTCMWGWIHGTKGGKPNEMYMLGYRCKILNADPKGMALPAPKTANKCPVDKTNCTIGAKQAHFWAQKERNNNMQDNGNDPPYYNSDYGFTDGAQTDLWDTANTPDKPTSVQAPSSSAPVTGGGESLSTLTLTVTSTKTATVTATVTANARDVRRSRMRP
jgi:hypothetical protein